MPFLIDFFSHQYNLIGFLRFDFEGCKYLYYCFVISIYIVLSCLWWMQISHFAVILIVEPNDKNYCYQNKRWIPKKFSLTHNYPDICFHFVAGFATPL